MVERGEARLAMRSALQQDAVWKGKPCIRMKPVLDKLSDIKQGRPARINRAALFCRYQRGTEAEKDDYTVTGYNYL